MLRGLVPPREGIACCSCKVYARMLQTNNWITADEVHPEYRTGRRFAFLEKRLGRDRARRLVAFLRRVKRSFKDTRVKTGSTLSQSTIYPLSIPLASRADAKWKMHPILRGDSGHLQLSVYAAEQVPGYLMHAPHIHPEEELLIMLDGEIELVLPDQSQRESLEAPRVRPGQVTFFPTGFHHSHCTVSQARSNYLICKWRGRPKPKPHQLSHGRFDALRDSGAQGGSGFSTDVLFEGPTENLRKLHCHVSTLAPGAGYEPHADPYDVLMVLLEGELQTLGEDCVPHHVIFYRAGQPHGVFNPGLRPSKYLVFEFHGA